MSIELKIPEVGESVREVQIGRWLKREGDAVALDENVVELETDKAWMELPRPRPACWAKSSKREGEMVSVGDVIGYVENGDAAKSNTRTHRGCSTSGKSRRETASRPHLFRPSRKPAAKAEPTPASEEPRIAKNTTGTSRSHPLLAAALREFGLKAADIDTVGDSDPQRGRTPLRRIAKRRKTVAARITAASRATAPSTRNAATTGTAISKKSSR